MARYTQQHRIYITRENLASEAAHIKALLNDLDKLVDVADLATIEQTKLVQMLRTTKKPGGDGNPDITLPEE